MKYPVPTIGLIALSLTGMAQSSSTAVSLSTLPEVAIHLKRSGPTLPCAFNHFQVIDQRADTARIGIHNFVPTLGSSHNEQLLFPQPAAAEITGYLDKFYARPEAHWSALIVLRTLWLSDANYIREDRVKDPDIAAHRTHIRLKAEIYAYNDSVYIPIIRFDTLQTYKRNNPYNNWTSYYSLWANDLTDILGEMTDSASKLTFSKTEFGRRLHREDILEFNKSRFSPAITASTVLTAGAYASFEEFRNNAPSIQNVEIRQEKKDHLLYIKDVDGISQYSRNAWGYCDGKNLFIVRDGKLYPLRKEGNAFYFLGQAYKEGEMSLYPNIQPAGNLFGDGPPPPQSAAPGYRVHDGLGNSRYSWTVNRIYTVDMDSGTIF